MAAQAVVRPTPRTIPTEIDLDLLLLSSPGETYNPEAMTSSAALSRSASGSPPLPPPRPTISLDDPLFDIPCLYVPELHNPESRALFALGLHDKAYRRSYCGATQYRRCQQHPDEMRKSVRTCMSRTCFSCIMRQADVATARLRKRHRNLFRVEKYSMIHIVGESFEQVPSHDEILAWRESISDIIREGLDPRPGTGALSYAVVEEVHCDRKHFMLAATILWWGRLEDATLDSLATVASGLEVTQHSPSTLYDNFHEMLCYTPPSSPEDCALLEQSLEGIRMLRTQGQMMRKDILCPEDALDIAHAELVANGMADKCLPVAPEYVPAPAPICSHCQKPLLEVSEWIPLGRKVTDFSTLSWHLEPSPTPPG